MFDTSFSLFPRNYLCHVNCLMLEVSLFDFLSRYDDENKENICFRYLRIIIFVIFSPCQLKKVDVTWNTVSIKGYKMILSWPKIN